MRTLLRVGGIAGALAGASALALAARAGLAVAALVAAAGLAAGLATARWLPPAWYGRQLGAGLRAGLVASAIAAPTTLIALLAFAPRGSAALNIGPIALAPGAHLGGDGATADALAVAIGGLLALVLAVLSARIFAADKSARFVKAVARAREASQPLREERALAPVLARRTVVPLMASAAGGAAQFDRLAGGQPALSPAAPRRRVPATPPEGIADTTTARRAMDVLVRRSAAPALRVLPPEPQPELGPQSEPRPTPAAPPAPMPPAPMPGAPALKRRGGRPAAARLTPEMIEALAAWARDTEEEEGDGDGAAPVAANRAGKGKAAAREPVESSYLNTPAPTPAPKRKRKKNATRDWIC